jgi:hypothetical protein
VLQSIDTVALDQLRVKMALPGAVSEQAASTGTP